jgi:glycosyltransferase involved in cell wall biosynthesis
MITIGGNVCIRNGFSLDYCFREAIESLFPVCDHVYVCDGQSDDGTWEALQEWAYHEKRIKLIQYKWPPSSIGTPEFWVDWLNFCREHIVENYHLQLDGDEVLSADAYETIRWFRESLNPTDRVSLNFERLNFWRDPKHIAPHGKLCGNRVIRFAPSDAWLPSDAPHEKAADTIAMVRTPDHPIHIFHYGFLRKRDAFFDKAAKCRHYFCGTQFINREDPRITAVRNKDGNWMEEIQGIDWTNQLMIYDGDHPEQMKPWLAERGWS